MLSIVIIGKNAERSVKRTVESVIASIPEHVSTELLYIDSASTDGTLEIVGQFPVTIGVLSADQPLCAASGRYIGSRMASGDAILFLDSDMELLPGWLPLALKVIESHPEIASIGGPMIEGDTHREATKGAFADGICNRSLFNDVDFTGGAALMRSSLLEKVGGWNPYIISDEEPELCLRFRQAGHRVVKTDAPMVVHLGHAPRTLSSLVARRRRRLFLGSGQVIRCHLHSPVLRRYLQERGFVFLPGAALFLFLICIVIDIGLRTHLQWLILGVLLCLTFGIDAVRSRSISTAVYHVVHRVFILECTVKGFFRAPRRPRQYPGRVSVSAPQLSSIPCGAVDAVRSGVTTMLPRQWHTVDLYSPHWKEAALDA
jgi:GT2 family glycosyltransferase